MDLLLVRELTGEDQNKMHSHYVLLLGAIEIGTNQRGRTPHTLQCIKCKDYFNGKTLAKSDYMLRLHMENDECIDRSGKYVIPKDRELRYKHYYSGYAKDFIIYADFEAINKKLVDQGFTDTDEFNFDKNHKLTEHEIVSARYLVMVNDSQLNPREDHPMFGKSFEFKGRDSRKVLQAFLSRLMETCNELNKELDLNFKIDYNSLSADQRKKA